MPVCIFLRRGFTYFIKFEILICLNISTIPDAPISHKNRALRILRIHVMSMRLEYPRPNVSASCSGAGCFRPLQCIFSHRKTCMCQKAQRFGSLIDSSNNSSGGLIKTRPNYVRTLVNISVQASFAQPD